LFFPVVSEQLGHLLSIKFSHRWSSPGALEVNNEKVETTPCCFNFSATGIHSQLRKNYALNLEFFKDVDPKAWSWRLASAGRMTVEISKTYAYLWPRLLKGKDRPNNMAAWDSMNQRWSEEVSTFELYRKRREEKARKGETGKDDDADAVDEEEANKAAAKTCKTSAVSTFASVEAVPELCSTYWPPRMNGKNMQDSTWLVLFHSPAEMKCEKRGKECIKIKDRWVAAERKLRELGEAKLGSVDCDRFSEWCEKQEVGHTPFVRRYLKGKRKTFYGDWDIDSLVGFIRS